MAQSRSPGYPSMSLPEAIDLVGKIYEANRTNTTDREAAAKDLGYSGLTGTSAKALADLVHYGLIERAGKGGIRVSQGAVDILYPDSPATRVEALRNAAAQPTLFAGLDLQFEGGHFSSNSLRAYLMRNGFASAAIPAIMKSYTETILFIRTEAGSESYSGADRPASEATKEKVAATPATPEPVTQSAIARPLHNDGVRLMDGERVIFVDEAGPGQYLKVVASGELDDVQIEALEDFIKRRKKRILRALDTSGVAVRADTEQEET